MATIGVIAFCFGQSFVLLDAFWKPLISLRFTNLDSMLMACMQIIVGLFGVTLTGYIFFSGQLNELAASASTLLRGKLSFSLLSKLDALMKYYSCVLYINDMTVSPEMCQLAREVRNELERTNLAHHR